MAKTPILSKADRRRLTPRREPYWSRIKTGCYVGYRKLSTGDGTWIARWRDGAGKHHYQSLGHFERYDSAVKEADPWFSQNEIGIRPKSVTVSEMCRDYIEHLRVHKGAASALDAQGRFDRLVFGSRFGDTHLTKLKASDVSRWLNAQVESVDADDLDDMRRAKDTANRNLTSLKAALNFAFKNQLVVSDAGWKPVTRFPKVGKRREYFLSLDERRRLLDACPHDLRLLATALLLTGARPGEIATARVNDFDRAQGTLKLIGKTGDRTISLSTKSVAFFNQRRKGKIGNATLLDRSDGTAWNKDAWKKIFRRAAREAGLPDSVAMYSLRHTAISEMIVAGLDSFLVARMAGTSTAMIDKHYGHLRHDRTRQQLDQADLI